MMDRRAFLGTLAVFAMPLAAEAQDARRVWRIGILTPAAAQWQPAVFKEAMRGLGYEEPTNLTIIVREASGRLDMLPRLAAELVREKVDVIVANTTPGVRAAIDATTTTPIVMSQVADPVALGFVASIARPGGNVTGGSNLNREITGKRLELLKDTVRGATRIAVLLHPDDPIAAPQVEDTKAAAARLRIEPRLFAVRNGEDLRRAFAAMSEWRAQAVFRLAGQALSVSKETIELTLRHRVPSMLLVKEEVVAGGLMCYDTDRIELFRRSAHFVDKILKGAKPADLPIEQPTKFELVINLKTAKVLGLTIPSSLLARADEVIQ